jgi:AmmeMemoRadiSam system protein A
MISAGRWVSTLSAVADELYKVCFMYIPKSYHSTIVLETLLEYFRSGKDYYLDEADLPPFLLESKGCFVSFYLAGDVMRGCMGTIEPVRDHLYSQIQASTLQAAFADPRFPPLREMELNDISIMVQVTSKPERVHHYQELDSARFGVIVKNELNQTGVLLPRCKGVETAEQQLSIAMQKGGIDPKSWDPSKFKLYRFSVEEFH